MGVYIPNMEIPKSCGKCPFNVNSLKCSRTSSGIDRDFEFQARNSDCPLLKVPVPHGRLADCDAVEECLKEVTDGEMKDYAMMLLDWAVSKRTVIEREDA